MTQTATITNADKLRELKREGHQRSRVYPRLIEQGRLTPEQAGRQNDILRAIILDYEAAVEMEKRQADLFGALK